MGLPRQLPPGDPGSGYGPFGDKAFKGALIGCVVLVVLGVVLVVLGGDAPSAVGTAFVALGVLGLVTGGAGLLAERLLRRGPAPPPSVPGGNGRGPSRTQTARRERIRRRS
jgi:drug/metabolite transporter (DMT)-like permease